MNLQQVHNLQLISQAYKRDHRDKQQAVYNEELIVKTQRYLPQKPQTQHTVKTSACRPVEQKSVVPSMMLTGSSYQKKQQQDHVSSTQFAVMDLYNGFQTDERPIRTKQQQDRQPLSDIDNESVFRYFTK